MLHDYYNLPKLDYRFSKEIKKTVNKIFKVCQCCDFEILSGLGFIEIYVDRLTPFEIFNLYRLFVDDVEKISIKPVYPVEEQNIVFYNVIFDLI